MTVTRLQSALAESTFCVTAELVPPTTTDPGAVLARVEALRHHVHAINVTDGAGAKTTMSSLAAAAILAQSGMEPVLQITCRDRNRIALAGDLIGAAALGIHNLLPLFGDDPTHGDQPEATSVHDLNTLGLIRLACNMRDEGKLPSGRPIEPPPAFFIGAADVPRVPENKPPGLLAKVEAGARFVQTQFCFDLDLIRRYLEGLDKWGVLDKVGILIGIGPLNSLKSARWMQQNLWGTAIPDTLLSRLSSAPDQAAEGHRICIELIHALRDLDGIAGVHLMAPGRDATEVAALLSECGVTT